VAIVNFSVVIHINLANLTTTWHPFPSHRGFFQLPPEKEFGINLSIGHLHVKITPKIPSRVTEIVGAAAADECNHPGIVPFPAGKKEKGELPI
jgi:hypothetical protein